MVRFNDKNFHKSSIERMFQIGTSVFGMLSFCELNIKKSSLLPSKKKTDIPHIFTQTILQTFKVYACTALMQSNSITLGMHKPQSFNINSCKTHTSAINNLRHSRLNIFFLLIQFSLT